MRILQIFTSREGQTQKIMQTMAEELQGLDHEVEVRRLFGPAQAMTDLAEFDWVLIGGSIHYGKHEAFLADFIHQHQGALAQTQTLLFSVNLTARKPEKNTPETNPYLKKFVAQLGWQPTRQHVFAGALLYSQYRFWDKQIIRFIMWLTKGNTDTSVDIDYTDWQQVRELAKELGKGDG